MMLKLSVCLLAAVVIAAGYSAPTTTPIQKAKLKFKVSARNLPDEDTGFGTSDAYFIVYSSDDGGRTKSKIARSDTINDSENPDWGSTYDFDFDRNKNQWFGFYVWDSDTLSEDENLGRVFINVADYVDKGQFVQANLDKKHGYLIVKSVDNQPQPSLDTPVGMIPLAAGVPKSQTLRFKISASGLPTKDDVGFIPGSSDPYVIVSVIEGPSGKARDVGRTTTVSSSSNPNWGDVLTFNWDQSKDQRLRFRMFDEDNLRTDDKLGTGYIEVNDYVAKGQTYTLPLPNKGLLSFLHQTGFLTITKA